MFLSRSVSGACLLFAMLAVAGCNRLRDDKTDPIGNMIRQDYRDLRQRPVAADYAAKRDDGPPIPDLIAPVPPAAVGQDRGEALVSISVTDTVPLRDVLIELTRKARVNLELDPRVRGGVFFSAYNQPFAKVMERLADLAGLRYLLVDNTLRVMPDEPYTQEYRVDYLNLNRSSERDVAISTNVFDSDVGVGNSGNTARTRTGSGDNHFTARVKSSANADFWGELEKNLASIIATHGQSTGASGKEKAADKGTFSLNRQTGMVTVYGNGRQHRAIERFITQTKRMARLQVLIEARIVEVELGEQFRSGINWRTLFDKGGSTAARLKSAATGAPFVSAFTATDGVFTANYSSGDFAAILNLVREFGAIRVLSAPRLTVLNNQAAVMKVARNEVYFTTSAQFPTTVTTGGVPISGTSVFNSTPRTMPDGLVMTVQPSINPDNDEVTLMLRPTISRMVDRVSDQSIGLNAAQNNINAPVDSKIPVLAVRELDSVLRMRSGEVGVMGGLMQDSSINSDKGVPPLDERPLVGSLARSRDNSGTVSELVILLRATITDQAKPDSADLDNKYAADPRSLLPDSDEPVPTAAPVTAVTTQRETLPYSASARPAPAQRGAAKLRYENGRFTLPQRQKAQ